MHAILFAVKRIFHKSVWFCRSLLKDYLLTPSRFDILFILQQKEALELTWLRQSAIREILGIRGPTLSRMIKALVELGFIRRERCTVDRRQYRISLTRLGRATVAHATRTIIDSGIITSAVVHFVCTKWDCPSTTLREVDNLQMTFWRMREGLCDEATMFYPWHPDDAPELDITPSRAFLASWALPRPPRPSRRRRPSSRRPSAPPS